VVRHVLPFTVHVFIGECLSLAGITLIYLLSVTRGLLASFAISDASGDAGASGTLEATRIDTLLDSGLDGPGFVAATEQASVAMESEASGEEAPVATESLSGDAPGGVHLFGMVRNLLCRHSSAASAAPSVLATAQEDAIAQFAPAPEVEAASLVREAAEGSSVVPIVEQAASEPVLEDAAGNVAASPRVLDAGRSIAVEATAATTDIDVPSEASGFEERARPPLPIVVPGAQHCASNAAAVGPALPETAGDNPELSPTENASAGGSSSSVVPRPEEDEPIDPEEDLWNIMGLQGNPVRAIICMTTFLCVNIVGITLLLAVPFFLGRATLSLMLRVSSSRRGSEDGSSSLAVWVETLVQSSAIEGFLRFLGGSLLLPTDTVPPAVATTANAATAAEEPPADATPGSAATGKNGAAVLVSAVTTALMVRSWQTSTRLSGSHMNCHRLASAPCST
jgi:hypothetical protein